MSSSKQLIINCGSSRVTAALVDVRDGGIELDKLATVPLDYDFSDDEAWVDAVRFALLELSKRHQFSGQATVIIPGNQVLTKTIRIPHVEASKRAQILAFEAQQNIPYPLHEVVWDSQEVGDDGVETEVLIIACKANTISAICSSVRSAGFSLVAIRAATIVEYNALQFAYAESSKDRLLVNIGARTTNLIFTSEKGFFPRNVQMGGNTLTQGIADSLGKPFAQAEEVKLKFFKEEVDYSDDDSGAKLLQGPADAFIRRTGQEITRSIVNYRRQKNAPAPKGILLTGRGSLLPGLPEQLSAGQKMPVEFFDPLENVTLGSRVTASPEDLRMELSEIIGEACRGLVPNGVGVNLLPEDVQAELVFKARKPWLFLAAICLALAPWPVYFTYNQISAAYAEQVRVQQARIQPLQQHQAAIAAAAEQAQAVSDSIEQVKGLVSSKSNWIRFFATLQDSLMQIQDAWLDELSVKRVQQASDQARTFEVILKGQLLVRESISEGNLQEEVLTRRIRLLVSSFEDSEYIDTSKPPSINFESLRKGFNVLPFSVSLMVDASKSL